MTFWLSNLRIWNPSGSLLIDSTSIILEHCKMNSNHQNDFSQKAVSFLCLVYFLDVVKEWLHVVKEWFKSSFGKIFTGISDKSKKILCLMRQIFLKLSCWLPTAYSWKDLPAIILLGCNWKFTMNQNRSL